MNIEKRCIKCLEKMTKRFFIEKRESDENLNYPHEHEIELWFCSACKQIELINDQCLNC